MALGHLMPSARSIPTAGSHTHSGLSVSHSKPDLTKRGTVVFYFEAGTSSQNPCLSQACSAMVQYLTLPALAWRCHLLDPGPSLQQRSELHQHGPGQDSAFQAQVQDQGRLKSQHRSRQQAGASQGCWSGRQVSWVSQRPHHPLGLWWSKLTSDPSAKTVCPFSVLYP